jgi:hypothetical protein
MNINDVMSETLVDVSIYLINHAKTAISQEFINNSNTIVLLVKSEQEFKLYIFRRVQDGRDQVSWSVYRIFYELNNLTKGTLITVPNERLIAYIEFRIRNVLYSILFTNEPLSKIDEITTTTQESIDLVDDLTIFLE